MMRMKTIQRRRIVWETSIGVNKSDVVKNIPRRRIVWETSIRVNKSDVDSCGGDKFLISR